MKFLRLVGSLYRINEPLTLLVKTSKLINQMWEHFAHEPDDISGVRGTEEASISES
jgi:hypothetical protein